MNLINTRKKVNSLLSNYNLAKRQCRQEQQKLQAATDHLAYVEEAQTITQQVAQQVQKQAHNKIAGVVARCLQTIFGSDYGFKIDFERKRGRTEANLILIKNGNEVDDPLDCDSGGVIDICGFALRLSCIILAKPRLRRILVLDEPFKFVSSEFRENVRTLLEGLANDFGVQILMVTHIEELVCGKVIKL